MNYIISRSGGIIGCWWLETLQSGEDAKSLVWYCDNFYIYPNHFYSFINWLANLLCGFALDPIYKCVSSRSFAQAKITSFSFITPGFYLLPLQTLLKFDKNNLISSKSCM